MSKNDSVVTSVYKSTNYEKFTFDATNRVVREKHVKALKIAMAKKDLGKDNPILVDKFFNILDGQHRYTARVELGLPIYYSISDETTLIDVPEQNSLISKWTMDDYCRSHSARGNYEYTKLIEFVEQYKDSKLSLAHALRILGYHNRGQSIASAKEKVSTNVKHGKFVFPIGSEHILDTENIIEIASYFGQKFHRTIVSAYMNHMKTTEEYDHDQMIKNLNRKKVLFLQNVPDLAEELNSVYNYRLTAKNKITFFGLK